MTHFVRFILILALVVTTWDWTNELLPDYPQGDLTTVSTPSFSQHHTKSNRQFPCSSDAELGGSRINIHQQGTSRVFRVSFSKSFFELRSITQKLAERDAVITKCWEKACDSNKF